MKTGIKMRVGKVNAVKRDGFTHLESEAAKHAMKRISEGLAENDVMLIAFGHDLLGKALEHRRTCLLLENLDKKRQRLKDQLELSVD